MMRTIQKSVLALAALTLVFGALGGAAQAKPSEEELAKIQEAAPEKPTAEPKAERKVLVFNRCEGFVHSSVPYADAALKILGEKTGAYAADFSNDLGVFTADNLKQYDAVIFNNSTGLKFEDPAARQTLMDFVKGGKGVVGIHAATDSFYEWPEAAEMMGGLFAGHPWGGGGTWAVKVDDPGHPLNAAFGGEGFQVNDEIYMFKGPHSPEDMRVLLSLDFSDPATAKVKPAEMTENAISWIRTWGDGRVFQCSLGHNHHLFWTPEVLKHYLDGIQYALGDLEADATPTAQLEAASKTGDAPTADAGGRAPLKIELPKPLFIGTPKDIAAPNMDPATGQSRPPFLAPTGLENVALGKEVTSSDMLPIIGELELITDGDKEGVDGSYVELGPDRQWVQIDLGAEYELFAILLWHYHSQARVYHDVVVQCADDPDFLTGVKTLYNNDHDNSSGLGVGKDKAYVETNEGRLIDAEGATTRYLRLYSNGNTSNAQNHYIEVEAWGRPAK